MKRGPFPLSSPYIMYAVGELSEGNKQAIDGSDYSLFISMIKAKDWTQQQIFY